MNELTSSEEDLTSGRCDPLGASNEDISSPALEQHTHCELCEYSSEKYEAKLQNLEEEHEMLNSSLCALTTHFAQVQFRLRQAVGAPNEDKEVLLKSLEEFAFRGIPNVGVVRERLDEAKLTEDMWLRRVKQQQLIEKLKLQLRELGLTFIGEPKDNIPKNQEITFGKFKNPVNLQLNTETCKIIPNNDNEIDETLDELMAPFKMKDELVIQLKTQIVDLERFVSYLQANNGNQTSCTCRAIHSIKKSSKTAHKMKIIKRAFALLHMFAMIHLSRSPQHFSKRNVNHWGDLRAKLEMAIAMVLEAIKTTGSDKSLQQGDYNSDNETSSTVSNIQVTLAVRKHLAVSIRDLMQHGAHKETAMYGFAPFLGCLKQKFSLSDTPIHAWEIILHYYQLANGESFNATPVRKLSQSFDLDIAGVTSKSNEHAMLSEIGNIISTHAVYKQSYDFQFKAFICAGLNANKLVAWLGIIFQCRALLTMRYHSWSYAIKTGFSDSLHSLNTLTDLQFDLPVDLAIRRFQNMQDVFNELKD